MFYDRAIGYCCARCSEVSSLCSRQVRYLLVWKGPGVTLAWSLLSGHLLVCDGQDLHELVFPGRTSRQPWHLSAEFANLYFNRA